MKTFFDQRIIPSGEEIGTRVTNTYLELELPLTDQLSYFVYIVPRTEHSAFVAMCWERSFDDLLANWDVETAEIVSSTWPTLATLLGNGMKDIYQQGALIRMEDTDHGETKWFVVSVAGNISFESAEEVLGERTLKAVGVVISRSMELFVELNENKPSMLQSLGRGIMEGVMQFFNLAPALFLGGDDGSGGTSFEKPATFRYFEGLRNR